MRRLFQLERILAGLMLLMFIGLLPAIELYASPIGTASSQDEVSTPEAPAAKFNAVATQDRLNATTGILFRVTIERVEATNNFDGPFGFDRADFFGRVRIDTQTQESQVMSNDDDIAPAWEFASTVLMDDSIEDEVVTLTIGVWDADDFNNAQEAD